MRSNPETSDIPEDIINRLQKDFTGEADYKIALSIIHEVKNDLLNVGWVQLSRAIILLANGDLKKNGRNN